jgi:predicted PurR-regulated permease PerM
VLPLLAAQTINLTTALAEGYANVRQSAFNGTSLLLRQLVLALPVDIRLLQSAVSQSAEAGMESSLGGMGSVLQQVFGVGLGLIFVLFLAVNWSVEGDRFLHTLLLLSNQRREFIREKIANLEDRISRYLRGLSLLSLIVGVMALAGYLAIGLPYALILAIFAGIMEAVPVIGPALGAVPAIIIALSISPSVAIAVIVISVVIQVAENIWIFPRVMGSSLGVPPFLTLVVMLIFSTLFGAVGAFIAIPLAAVGKVLLDAVGEYLREQTGNGIGRDRMSVVRYEIQELIDDIRSQARSREIEPSEEMLDIEESLEAIAVDLDVLLKQTDGEQPR